MSTNPFRQPLPSRKAVVLKERLWNATDEGKDSSTGEVRLLATDTYLWFGRSLSVPLAWIETVEPTGPGFTLVWFNEITREAEGAIFCIRTFSGYDVRKRDSLIKRLFQLAQAARAAGAPAVESESEAGPTCQKCGQSGAQQCDFRRFISVVFYWAAQTDRAVLCRKHASRRLHLNLLFNALFGVWGLPGIFITPFCVVFDSNAGRRDGFISPLAVLGFVLLSSVPLAAMVWGIASGIKGAL